MGITHRFKGGVGFAPASTSEGDTPVLRRAKVFLTSEQITHIVVAPVLVVPAPGPGLFVYPFSVVYQSFQGTTLYSGGPPDAGLFYGNSPTGSSIDSGDFGVFRGAGSPRIGFSGVLLQQNNAGVDGAAVVGMPVYYTGSPPTPPATSTEYADGDGTGSITVDYVLLPAS